MTIWSDGLEVSRSSSALRGVSAVSLMDRFFQADGQTRRITAGVKTDTRRSADGSGRVRVCESRPCEGESTEIWSLIIGAAVAAQSPHPRSSARMNRMFGRVLFRLRFCAATFAAAVAPTAPAMNCRRLTAGFLFSAISLLSNCGLNVTQDFPNGFTTVKMDQPNELEIAGFP